MFAVVKRSLLSCKTERTRCLLKKVKALPWFLFYKPISGSNFEIYEIAGEKSRQTLLCTSLDTFKSKMSIWIAHSNNKTVMIERSIKKEIAQNWSDRFAGLSVYAQNKLYKICGAFVFGIRILSLPGSEDYRPLLEFYPLWKSGVRECFDEPLFIQEIHNKKGFQFNIPYAKHPVFFQEAVACTREQVPALSCRELSLGQLFELFDKQFSQTLIMASPVGKAKLFVGKLYGALYVNNKEAIQQVWSELNQAATQWPPDLFEWRYGKPGAWLLSLQETINNREAFLKQIALNMQDKKLAKLHRCELTF